jgi:hypothetical protein
MVEKDLIKVKKNINTIKKLINILIIEHIQTHKRLLKELV